MSDIEETQFTWVPIHLEAARKLREFRGRSAELVALLQRMHDEDLKALSIRDRDAAGEEFPLDGIDPFSFLANFNRGVTDANRRALWDFLKREWDLEAPVPDDFDGIPVADMRSSWLFPFKARRDDDHFELLWEFFDHILDADYETLDLEMMEQCLAKRKVGLASLTMGMFWARPDVWVSADGKNLAFGKTRGFTQKPGNASDYRDWGMKVRKTTDDDVLQFSREAHLWAIEKSQGTDDAGAIKAPFDQLFETREQGNKVLEAFEEAIMTLNGTDSSRHRCLVTSIRYASKRTKSINLNFGGWAILRYRSDGRWLVILPEEFADKCKLEKGLVFKNWVNNDRFCLCLMDNEMFREPETQEAFYSCLEPVHSIFDTWDKSPLFQHHVEPLYQAMVDPEARDHILATGISRHKDSEFGAPFDFFFADWEEAQIHLDFLREVALILQSGSTEKDPKLHVSYRHRSKSHRAINLNFKLWPAVWRSIDGDKDFWEIRVTTEFGKKFIAEHSAEHQNENFDGDFCGIAVDSAKISDPDFLEEIRPELEKLRDYFAGQGASSYNHAHETDLYDAIMFPEKREEILLQGLSKKEKADSVVEEETQSVSLMDYTREDALRDLFVDSDVLDRMMALLRRKKNLILQGAPGTGKTFIARRLAYLLMGATDKSRAPMIQFHQSTSYEDFIQGFRPDDEGHFILRNGVFHDFCRAAMEFPDEPHVFVIDEINRGNLSKIFGELMLLIEPDKRGEAHAIRLAYGDSESETFHVPSNIHLIGTMNTADRSLSLVDYALRRRFAFVEMEPGFDSPAFAETLARCGISASVVDRIRQIMRTLNERIERDALSLGRGYRIGHSFFTPTHKIEDEEAWFREILDYEVAPLVEEYWADDPKGLDEAAAILKQ
ncbi:AAA family ATPase [Verrucomicrobiales bacterium]|nr:AAA family ATPase [Verrucomicrobiales bacterium]